MKKKNRWCWRLELIRNFLTECFALWGSWSVREKCSYVLWHLGEAQLFLNWAPIPASATLVLPRISLLSTQGSKILTNWSSGVIRESQSVRLVLSYFCCLKKDDHIWVLYSSLSSHCRKWVKQSMVSSVLFLRYFSRNGSSFRNVCFLPLFRKPKLDFNVKILDRKAGTE